MCSDYNHKIKVIKQVWSNFFVVNHQMSEIVRKFGNVGVGDTVLRRFIVEEFR